VDAEQKNRVRLLKSQGEALDTGFFQVLSISGMKRLTFCMLISAMTSIRLNAKAMYASLDLSDSVCEQFFRMFFTTLKRLSCGINLTVC
jgi:hypothetical protein